jgi:hypothetical protein
MASGKMTLIVRDGPKLTLVGAQKYHLTLAGPPRHRLALTARSGPPGRSPEFQASATHLQWRYAGAADWTDLVTLADLDGTDGTDGADGREVELQASATHLQWHYAGAAAWTDLIALSEIGRTQTYTFATLPAAGSYVGQIVRVSDVGVYGSTWEWTGALWRPVNGRYRHHRLAAPITGANTSDAQLLDYTAFPDGLLADGDEIEVFLRLNKSGTSATFAVKLLFETVADPLANAICNLTLAGSTPYLATRQRFRVLGPQAQPVASIQPVTLGLPASYGTTATFGTTGKPLTAGATNYLSLVVQRTSGTTEYPYVAAFAVEVHK